MASLSKEAEETRLRLRQELIDILSGSTDARTDGLVNGEEADGGSLPEDLGAEDYEVPTLTAAQTATKVEEPDKESTTSLEKKPDKKTSVSHSKSNSDMKTKKKTLTRTKSSGTADLPSKDARKKEGNLIETTFSQHMHFAPITEA